MGTKSDKTILIVDDEYAIVEVLSEVLAWEGYRVETAHDGRSALAAVDRVRPALVLLDFMMPGMDGAEVLRTLRARPEFASVPVVMMSAVPDALPAELKQEGFLRKPFTVDALVERLNRVLGPRGG